VEDTLLTFRKLALGFFILIGGTHILTGLMVSNDYFLPISNVINRVLDIPFAMITYFYACTWMEIHEKNPRRNMYFILMAIGAILLFLLFIYINLFLPDRTI